MTKPPETRYDPPRVFYLVAVNDALQRGDHAEIQQLLEGAKAVKAQHGDLDKLIAKLEGAAKKAQG
jgi:tRNA G37 N-methylase TrmD